MPCPQALANYDCINHIYFASCCQIQARLGFQRFTNTVMLQQMLINIVAITNMLEGETFALVNS